MKHESKKFCLPIEDAPLPSLEGGLDDALDVFSHAVENGDMRLSEGGLQKQKKGGAE